METIFDGVKGVYRVYNPDGSWNTYTPAQFKELGLEVEEVEEEGDADIVLEIKDENVSNDVSDTPTTGDAPDADVPTTGDAPDADVPTTGDAPDLVVNGTSNPGMDVADTLTNETNTQA